MHDWDVVCVGPGGDGIAQVQMRALREAHRESKPAPVDHGPDHHSGPGSPLQAIIAKMNTKQEKHRVRGIQEEKRIGDSARRNRGSMATLSASPLHPPLAPQLPSSPPPRDDT